MPVNFEKKFPERIHNSQSSSRISSFCARPSFKGNDNIFRGRDINITNRNTVGDLDIEGSKAEIYNSKLYGDITASFGNIDIQFSTISGHVKNENSKDMYFESLNLMREFFSLEKKLNCVIKHSHIKDGLNNKDGAVYMKNSKIDRKTEIKNGYLILDGNNYLDELYIPADKIILKGKSVINKLYTFADGPICIPKGSELISDIEFDRRGEGIVIIEEGGKFIGNVINGRIENKGYNFNHGETFSHTP